jgi:hypothetical protein
MSRFTLSLLLIHSSLVPFLAAVHVGLAVEEEARTGVATGQTPTSSFQVVEDDEGLLLTEGDDKILFYQRKPRSLNGRFTRANYVHPLFDLEGNALTEDFPADHRHHRGIFWAWHQVWLGDQRIGDPWVTEDFAWDVRSASVASAHPDSVALKAHVHWRSPLCVDASGKHKPLVSETTVIRAHRAERDARKIDFEISLLALEDHVRIGGSENEKGYGGFSVRLCLPEDVRFRGPNGPVEPQMLSVKAEPWMDVRGTHADSDRMFGVAILCHPSLPGFPQRWILRKARSLQNPVYPGREAVPLSRDQPLVLRYRLVIHRGDAEPATLQRWHQEYRELKF